MLVLKKKIWLSNHYWFKDLRKNKIKISVVISTCDRTKQLRSAIKSVLRQSIRPFEILIINNGKLSIKKKDIQKNIIIKVKNITPYIGIATARNVGGINAKGDYVAFLDDDDFWPKNYLKNFINEIDKTYDCFICKIVGFNNNIFFKWKTPTISKIKIQNLFIKNPGINGSNLIVKKKVFKDCLFDKKLKTGEDKSFIIDLLLKNKKVKILKKSYSYYYASKDKTKLSHSSNVLVGKVSFLKKYFFQMDFKTKIKILLQVYYLLLKNFKK